jgi:parallel beta-helix repeat protein
MKNKVGRVGLVLIIMISSFAGIFAVIPKEALAYTPHAPIFIDGNSHFAVLAAYEGWVGNGTEGNPYIIEGYDIDSLFDVGIELNSTTVHFIVRDSLIRNSWVGIIFKSVTNGTISNCTIQDNWWGAFIKESHGIKITKNNFSENLITNIDCVRSNYNYIADNIINSGGNEGILLEYSKANNITNNTLEDSCIFIRGTSLTHWNTHNIDSSNTVNGKPVYFWKNRDGGVIPPGAGQVILANCKNVTIENQEVHFYN